jgi:hypothetical protein
MGTVRRGIGWQGPVGPELIAALAGFDRGSNRSAHALSHPVEWALDVLHFDGADLHGSARTNGTATNGGAEASTGPGPSPTEIQRRYRRLLIEAHPDHGGAQEDAAQRIADLTEARRILLG